MRLLPLLVFTIILIINITLPHPAVSATFRGKEFTIETGLPNNPSPTPSPILLQTTVQTGFFNKQNAKPLRLTLSSDLIDFGPLAPTNPIKRQLNISADKGSANEVDLFTFENHPLKNEGQIIPDTTCDNGNCNEKKADLWLNPLTFGFGFSLDDVSYQQFPDNSKSEPLIPIPTGKITIKLNLNQTQILSQDKYYENTIIFLALPKF